MGRQLHKLNAMQIARLLKDGRRGRHGDGGGLYLSIDAGDRKRWVFLFRDRDTGRLREMGLGSAGQVSLALAREKAQAARGQLKVGRTRLPPPALPSLQSRSRPSPRWQTR